MLIVIWFDVVVVCLWLGLFGCLYFDFVCIVYVGLFGVIDFALQLALLFSGGWVLVAFAFVIVVACFVV